ncbi:MAG: hypothetical protein ACT6S0_16070 [Roseateles sp.]|uniref:hypothetical protein n=1 Tax=Roseateles sp. TaxID=1971397 RepID=UPI004036BFBA
MKRLALAITLISSAALLSGCIIVPHRHGGHRGQGHHYQSDGHYQGQDGGHYQRGGRVYGNPGPRR